MSALLAMARPQVASIDYAQFLRVEQEWRVFEMPSTTAWAGFYSLLLENAGLPGAARYCLTGAGRPVLRADIQGAAFDEDDIDDSLATWPPHPCDPASSVEAFVECILGRCLTGETADAVRLCDLSGWPHTVRANNTVAVDLELSTGAASAVVSSGDTGLSVATDMVAGDSFTTFSREAIALLLLRIAGAVRMIRPTARVRDDGQTIFQLSVHLPAHSPPAHLANAFAALSRATDWSRAECRALTMPAVAGVYLTTASANLGA